MSSVNPHLGQAKKRKHKKAKKPVPNQENTGTKRKLETIEEDESLRMRTKKLKSDKDSYKKQEKNYENAEEVEEVNWNIRNEKEAPYDSDDDVADEPDEMEVDS